MSTKDKVFAEQTQAKIKELEHELIQLQAEIEKGTESEEQLQVAKQRVIELKSQIDSASKQLAD